jgi:hypothetical protein
MYLKYLQRKKKQKQKQQNNKQLKMKPRFTYDKILTINCLKVTLRLPRFDHIHCIFYAFEHFVHIAFRVFPCEEFRLII